MVALKVGVEHRVLEGWRHAGGGLLSMSGVKGTLHEARRPIFKLPPVGISGPLVDVEHDDTDKADHKDRYES